ncbi:hypothetical protein [Streptomyces lateritius]|uniref:hypothetical protein n=1 Tax=Streptomyces lateritius TaxID=67313 RepID=UPI001679CBE2|nr:hypothetical protein [Streptomyces lateritius]
MTAYQIDVLMERALRPGGGFLARRAAARLCRPEAIRQSDSGLVEQLVRILRSAPDPHIAAQAARTLADPRVSGDPELLASTFVAMINRSGYRGGANAELGVRVLDFLLGPPAGETRLESFLGAAHPRSDWWTSPETVSFWFVKEACATRDNTVRARAGAFLSGTAEPHLLSALERVVLFDICKTFYLPALHTLPPGWEWQPLWSGGELSPRLRLHLANPRLPLRPPHGPSKFGPLEACAGPLLAVLSQREDLIADYLAVHGPEPTVSALLKGAAESSGRAGFAADCRSALCGLPAGPAREELCRHAARWGSEVGQSIVRETGWVWDGDEASFCWFTEQWERYDALDPDGARLRVFGLTRKDDRELFRRAERIAEENGRPNPLPPPPPFPKRTPPSPSPWQGGSWPTSPGASYGGGF